MINSKNVIVGFLILALMILDVTLAWKVDQVEVLNIHLNERIDALEQENEELRKHVPDSIGKLVTAMIWIESSNNDSALNKRENAVGCLQIRQIMLHEVNRICNMTKNGLFFALDDRWSRDKSLHMFAIWQQYHHPSDSLEKIARNWNGGPKGYASRKTNRYWKKVKKQLKKLG
jgi:hypothetical protein